MTKKQKKDATKSAEYFNKISDSIGDFFGGLVVSFEGRETFFERQLDRDYAIDGVIVTDGGTMPYSQRTQFNKPYRAFSVRKNRTSGNLTEWDKLLRAESTRDIRPQISFSVYVDEKSNAAQVAFVDTADLINFIADGHAEKKSHENGEFYSASWEALRRAGYGVPELQVTFDDKGSCYRVTHFDMPF